MLLSSFPQPTKETYITAPPLPKLFDSSRSGRLRAWIRQRSCCYEEVPRSRQNDGIIMLAGLSSVAIRASLFPYISSFPSTHISFQSQSFRSSMCRNAYVLAVSSVPKPFVLRFRISLLKAHGRWAITKEKNRALLDSLSYLTRKIEAAIGKAVP